MSYPGKLNARLSSWPGLSYPKDNNYLTQVKDRGYFILVDRNAKNIALLPGGEINTLLAENNKLLFVFGSVDIVGTKQDIIDTLYLSGLEMDEINKIISAGISIDNLNTPESQQWITIFKNRNITPTTLVTQPTTLIVPPVTRPITLIVPLVTRPTTLTVPPVTRPTTLTVQPMIQMGTTQPRVAQPVTRTPVTPTIQTTQIIQPQVVAETPPNLSYPVRSNYSLDYIASLRKIIHDTISNHYLGLQPGTPEGSLGNNSNFETMPQILEQLFALYDQLFFRNQLTEIINKDKIQLNLGYSDKLTRTGGYCDRKGCVYSIRLSQPIMLGTFRKGEKSHSANGLQCYNRLACLMNVFEHELVHFVVEITHGHVKRDTIYKSHGLYFQQLVQAYFGHTEFKHALTRNIEKPGKKEDFNIGDTVSYESKTGEIITGVIVKLNPTRAVVGTVSVPYTILRQATQEEIDDNTMNMLGEKVATLTIGQRIPGAYNFHVGDIVSYTNKGQITNTGRISKINPKNIVIGQYKVPHQLVRAATEDERNRFLFSPEAQLPKEKTKIDFYLGQTVQFKDSKTGQTIIGTIQKLNPTRAVVGTYTVPYTMLTPS